MPTYDYECEQGHKTEDLQPSEVQAILCPECGTPARKLFPSPTIWSSEPRDFRHYSTKRSAFVDPDIGTYNSRDEYNFKLKEKGLQIREPGMDKETRRMREEKYKDGAKKAIEDTKRKIIEKAGGDIPVSITYGPPKPGDPLVKR